MVLIETINHKYNKLGWKIETKWDMGLREDNMGLLKGPG
jgi:hypothetical protein